nr:mitogen-activated protein kinase kinase kinase 8-like protein [Arenicola marina]
MATMQVVCVINLTQTSNTSEKGAAVSVEARRQAYNDIEKVCKCLKFDFTLVSFEQLDFGETEYLDKFYNADVAIVDMSIRVQQSSLSYHVGVRESLGMPETIIMVHDASPEFTLSVKLSCGTTDFLPYVLDKERRCVIVEMLGSDCCIKCPEKPLLLLSAVKKMLKEVELSHKTHSRDKFLNDLRKARENYKGKDLAEKLAVLRNRLDDPQLIAADVILNMLISYRDVQDYDSMVSLVEDLKAVPNSKVTDSVPVQHHFAFALNRRNKSGDRDKALTVIKKAIEASDSPVPDMLCLCGRIYKDKFIEAKYEDKEALEHAIEWYEKSFDLQPNEYAGINLATLLVISGRRFSTSATLQRIGVTLNVLIGRKGSLTSLIDYWDVATFFEYNVLAEEYGKAVQAAEHMFKLEPPIWYLKSTLGNIRLINMFRKVDEQTFRPEQRREKELFDFWMDFFNEATKNDTTDVRFPALILEPSKVFLPSYVQVNEEEEEESVRIWHVAPHSESRQIHDWYFSASSVKNISQDLRNSKAVFLYVHENSDDFHLFFPSEGHKQRFYEMIYDLMENLENNVVNLENEVRQTSLRFEYELDDKNNKVLLGRGTYGCVYAARDLDTQVRIAVKEVPEKYNEEVQPLHEEIALHARLSHKNIVKYLGSVSEEGFFKIFMEQVPGGSLSALLRSKWGPLKDNESTIAFYTRQILKGLKYLHDNKIVHRDIKGDNVLVNTYSGVLKISDFGTSKRLSGINPCADTFAGTLQYMAPEVIDKGFRGYGPAADIWSLGCTVIEMATGKPPFIELGPEAAMFKVGFYKIHPEFPPTLSEAAQDFLKRCFDPEPDTRASAAELLEHPFLSDAPKRKRKHNKPEQKNPDYGRSVSVPAGRLEHGSPGTPTGTPTSPQTPGPGHHPDLHLRIPPERFHSLNSDSFGSSAFGSDPPSPSPSPTPDSEATPLETGSAKDGFYLLRKDSERRHTLVKVLYEDQESVCDQWILLLYKDALGPNRKINKVHLHRLLEGFMEYIRDPQSKAVQLAIDRLKEEMDFDMGSCNELQLAVYVFQEAVSLILKQRHIQPHWMFALDTLLRGASQAALNILTPDLAANILGGARQEPHEEESTSGVSTFDSTSKPPELLKDRLDRTDSRDLHSLLRELEEENKRLLERLIESQKSYQSLLKTTLDGKDQQITLLKTFGASPGLPRSASETRQLGAVGGGGDAGDTVDDRSAAPADRVDMAMVEWLQKLDIDQDTIDKLIVEKFTKRHLLNWVTREDLRRLTIRGGMLCRLWETIAEHRRQVTQNDNAPT